MKVIADTNILVRAIADDDERQSEIARRELLEADAVILPTTALCELVWVLWRGYGETLEDVAKAVRLLLASANVVVDRTAVEAGLAMIDAGGDFADGVIAYEGKWLGGETFISFDREAVKLILAGGGSARLLS